LQADEKKIKLIFEKLLRTNIEVYFVSSFFAEFTLSDLFYTREAKKYSITVNTIAATTTVLLKSLRSFFPFTRARQKMRVTTCEEKYIKCESECVCMNVCVCVTFYPASDVIYIYI